MSLPSEAIHDYLTSNGLEFIPFQGADLAYGYRENEPVFAFIQDEGDGSKAFHNAMGLYWATAEYISKPWCLVMVTALPMMPHNRQMLDSLGTQYNIQLLEAPQDGAMMEVVAQQLNHLISVMQRYIDPNASNPCVSLGDSIKTWKMVPNRTTVPLTVTSGESEIEGVLLRLVQSEPHLVFYTEHRNLPSVFKLDLGDQTLTMRFEADKANIIEATSFESLITAFNSKREITLSDPNSGQTVFNMRAH